MLIVCEFITNSPIVIKSKMQMTTVIRDCYFKSEEVNFVDQGDHFILLNYNCILTGGRQSRS